MVIPVLLGYQLTKPSNVVIARPLGRGNPELLQEKPLDYFALLAMTVR